MSQPFVGQRVSRKRALALVRLERIRRKTPFRQGRVHHTTTSFRHCGQNSPLASWQRWQNPIYYEQHSHGLLDMARTPRNPLPPEVR